jgi:hypothetical protein
VPSGRTAEQARESVTGPREGLWIALARCAYRPPQRLLSARVEGQAHGQHEQHHAQEDGYQHEFKHDASSELDIS